MTHRKLFLALGVATLSVSLSACATGSHDRASTDQASGDQSSSGYSSSGQSSNDQHPEAVSRPVGGDMSGTAGSRTSDTSSTAGTSQDTSSSSNMGSSSDTSSGSGASDKVSMRQMGDEMVLNRMHHINQHEIQLAQLAQNQAQSAQVKSAAQTILTDHQKLDQQVQASAKSQGVTLQDFQPADYEKLSMERIKSLNGSQFDQAFIRIMRMGHTEAAQSLELARHDMKDSQVRTLIDAALPRIRAHRQMTVSLEKSLGASTQSAGIAAGAESHDSAGVSQGSSDMSHGSSDTSQGSSSNSNASGSSNVSNSQQ